MKSFNEYKDYVDEHLLDPFPEEDDEASVLFDSMFYSLNAGGKRLRPVLLLASCDMAGGNIAHALPYACAMEYIHTYSLIHDDLPAMDNDDLRRGKPTNHIVYGAGMATLAGDGLLSAAFEVMSSDIAGRANVGWEMKPYVMAEYEIASGAGVRGMVAGQTADIKAEKDGADNGLLHYIHLNKTAALIKAAVRAGLYIGKASDEMLDDMTVYAEDLGIAFQIADDILDVKSTTEELGKPVGSDEENDKATYVIINGLEDSEAELHRLTAEACQAAAPYDDDVFFRNLALDLEKRTK
ncbi:MAG: polyprenyl synthetase family protein [Eubacterium sp.]|nr:polyprenyl synthetase family protein [Eubacterium sp.]